METKAAVDSDTGYLLLLIFHSGGDLEQWLLV